MRAYIICERTTVACVANASKRPWNSPFFYFSSCCCCCLKLLCKTRKKENCMCWTDTNVIQISRNRLTGKLNKTVKGIVFINDVMSVCACLALHRILFHSVCGVETVLISSQTFEWCTIFTSCTENSVSEYIYLCNS